MSCSALIDFPRAWCRNSCSRSDTNSSTESFTDCTRSILKVRGVLHISPFHPRTPWSDKGASMRQINDVQNPRNSSVKVPTTSTRGKKPFCAIHHSLILPSKLRERERTLFKLACKSERLSGVKAGITPLRIITTPFFAPPLFSTLFLFSLSCVVPGHGLSWVRYEKAELRALFRYFGLNAAFSQGPNKLGIAFQVGGIIQWVTFGCRLSPINSATIQ